MDVTNVVEGGGARIGTKIHFKDHPEFTPNVTPRQMFQQGVFGGTYWRPIHSSVTSKKYHDAHKEFDRLGWWEGIPEENLSSCICDLDKNRYKVHSGTSLTYWEERGWIKAQDPYGWVQWYCRFYSGRRSPDDERQIKRWQAFAGPNGRFRKRLIKMCKSKRKYFDDERVSPVIRQGLLQWAYVLTESDFNLA